ncbi:unnamed protein product, partial [Effrenium voratum]
PDPGVGGGLGVCGGLHLPRRLHTLPGLHRQAILALRHAAAVLPHLGGRPSSPADLAVPHARSGSGLRAGEGAERAQRAALRAALHAGERGQCRRLLSETQRLEFEATGRPARLKEHRSTWFFHFSCR